MHLSRSSPDPLILEVRLWKKEGQKERWKSVQNGWTVYTGSAVHQKFCTNKSETLYWVRELMRSI